MIRESNPFARGFNTMEKGFNEEDRQTMLLPNALMRRQGLRLKRQGIDAANDRANRAYNLDLQKFNFSKQMAMEKIREFEEAQKGGINDYRQQKLQQGEDNLYMQGAITKQFKTPDGLIGTYKKNRKQNDIDQKTTASIPILADNMGTILSGIQSYLSAGGNLQRALDAISAYGTGKATPKQEKLLADSGISTDAITMAAESMQGVMNLPKIEDTYSDIRKMFTPRKGDTFQSFSSRLSANYEEQKKRAAYAEFRSRYGKPNDPTATIAQNNFIKEFMNTDQYGAPFEKGLPESNALPKAYSSEGGTSTGPDVASVGSNSSGDGSGVSEQDIKDFMYTMSQKGVVMSHDQAKSALEKINEGSK